jgi:cold shock protein
MMGTVKRLVREKGFGFLADADGQEYFFHRSAVEGTTFDRLQEGETVGFEPKTSQKGPRADRVWQV